MRGVRVQSGRLGRSGFSSSPGGRGRAFGPPGSGRAVARGVGAVLVLTLLVDGFVIPVRSVGSLVHSLGSER